MGEAALLQEPGLKVQYSSKFAAYKKQLSSLREKLEDRSAKPSKADMGKAKDLVATMRKDLQAFSRLKDVYGMAGSEASSTAPRLSDSHLLLNF